MKDKMMVNQSLTQDLIELCTNLLREIFVMVNSMCYK